MSASVPRTTPDIVHLLSLQRDRYIALGYPALAGITEEAFCALADDAIAQASTSVTSLAPGEGEPGEGGIGALLVVTRLLVSDEARVPLLRLPGSDRPGLVDRNHASDARVGLSHYVPRQGMEIPPSPVYVAWGVERGDEFRDVAPRDALPVIAQRGRSPLTIDEGISLATILPESLVKNHCFMLAGSTRGDKRVPALWIADKAPKLGWCFDGVPHTWLGVASVADRT